MNKQKILKILNIILAMDFLCLVTSALLNDVLPREVFAKLHPLSGFLLVLLVLSHIMLNWSWIKTNYSKKKHKD